MKNKLFYSAAALILIASITFWLYMFQSPSSQESDQPNSYEGDINLTMYSTPTCGCCVKWAEYLENNGVNVTVEKVMDLQSVKNEHGVPDQLSACHTAIVDGYVVEGHVPIEDIRRLLGERPDAIGVSVPGMPPNSPGMDQPVEYTYQSVLFDEERMTVFNTHE